MIEFDQVTKVYNGDVKAINNIDLTVNDGEFVILLGPSGCGKTTLLRMVNQLETMTEGDIRVQGKSISELNKIEMRRNIGYVIQSNGLFPNMTIEDNMMIVPDLLGWDRVKKRERFNYLSDLVGLAPDEFRNRYPHELSGGQQQRVGVARALAADPPVMLMDEPFGALDPIIRTSIQDEFLKIQREVKKTILFVSHDIDEAVRMGDRIALLRGGEIMQYDTPTNLLNRPSNEFVSEFVGQDRVLKSMSLYTVAHLMDTMNLKAADQTITDTKKVDMHTSLRNVIAMLLNREADQIVATNETGEIAGRLSLGLIEEFLEKEVKTKA
ncbi:betaine/proline/choline family ABC transporter ATP-binding protein [Paenalkalicoccus suaedae]|uniref:Quaternary amine transport ATP-binding protein n=1 Tax=Paenalkalicoccus suaedae TaxID=2592382 RepID=A0A859FJX7_9BACI|nr:betaine/proline/choline family ABC transporter ATP-binding protein [Paenalkalicoccus suaedae]QKS73099.1 betaine/proline/choline family ABC transporter ATP-binding protein [Paenalkalicoccus suaedae]